MTEKLNLIDVYSDAKESFYNKKENLNQKSRHWKIYDFREFNFENLKNFRSNGKLSEGLDDQNESFSFKVFANIINDISEDYLINNLPKKNIGNSDNLIKYKDVFIDYNKLIHIYWFWTVEKEILTKNNIQSVCEIGGGFGSFAELFIKNHNMKLLSIDLPEANLMTSYYLKEAFPEKNFFLFDSYKKKNLLSFEEYTKNDIIILPPNCNIDEKIKIDFYINARSMMEMNFDVIKKYFNFIQKHSHKKSFFLNINRYEKTSVGYPIRISDYPYDRNWKVLISKPSFNQNWLHFLLTQRNFEKGESNIEQELEKIKKIGKKFYGMYLDYSPKYMILKKIIKNFLKIFYGIKILNLIGKFLIKIGGKFKNLK